MRRLLFLFLFLGFISCYGQQNLIDSLIIRLEDNRLNDSLRLRLMNELAFTYRSTNADSSISIAKRTLQLATELNNLEEKGWALNGIASAQWMKANYVEVLRRTQESLEIFEKINHLKGIAQSYNTLANTYNMQGEHEESLLYYKKSIDTYELLEDTFNVARANANIGRTYYMIGKYTEALDFLKSVLDVYENQPENILYPIVLNTTGDVLQAQGKLNEALRKYEQALEITESSSIPRILTYSTRGLSEVYQKLERLDLSNQYARRTLDVSKEIGYLENVKNAALIISDNCKSQGKYDDALDYYIQYTAAKDSMFNATKEGEITKLKESLEIVQREKEIELLRTERSLQDAKANNQRILIYTIALIALLVLILGIVQYRKRMLKQRINLRLSKLNEEVNSQKSELEKTLETLNETKEELEQALETRNKFFSIISHDLKGFASQFSSAIYLLGVSMKEKNKEEMSKIIDFAQDSSNKMTRLLDNLLNWALKKNNYFPYSPENVNVEARINEALDLFATHLSSKNIHVIKELPADHFIYTDKNSTMTIIRNLLGNAIKFTPEGKKIIISSFISDDRIAISFADEGVGISPDKLDELFTLDEGKSTPGTSGEKGVGLGLHLVHEFVKLNKGEIKVESQEGKGTTFMISFPTSA